MHYFLFLFILILPSIALSASPTSFVSGPGVTGGETSVEGRIGFSTDNESASLDNRLQSRIHVDHGFTDMYALRIIAAQDKRDGDHLRQSAFTFENRFQIFEEKTDGFDGGFRLVYSKRNGNSSVDSVSANFIAQKNWSGQWQTRHNMIFDHEIGGGATSGMGLELRNQATKKIDPVFNITGLRLGLEALNDFGRLNGMSGYSNQSHTIGPVLKGKFENGLSFETGYRVGISRAERDHAFKFSLAKGF